jgi:hypothetical protein
MQGARSAAITSDICGGSLCFTARSERQIQESPGADSRHMAAEDHDGCSFRMLLLQSYDTELTLA